MGRGRAQSLGWPDAYSFTKALAEMAVLERADRRLDHDRAAVDHRVGAARAVARLDPGFRMTDPIILAYGRGALPEFPGIPDAVVDVVPVDIVVNAMLVGRCGRTRRAR